jgi:hypothetical protein
VEKKSTIQIEKIDRVTHSQKLSLSHRRHSRIKKRKKNHIEHEKIAWMRIEEEEETSLNSDMASIAISQAQNNFLLIHL